MASSLAICDDLLCVSTAGCDALLARTDGSLLADNVQKPFLKSLPLGVSVPTTQALFRGGGSEGLGWVHQNGDIQWWEAWAGAGGAEGMAARRASGGGRKGKFRR